MPKHLRDSLMQPGDPESQNSEPCGPEPHNPEHRAMGFSHRTQPQNPESWYPEPQYPESQNPEPHNPDS